MVFSRSVFSKSAFSRSVFSRSAFSRSGFSRSAFSRSVFSRSGVWGLGFRGLCFRDTPGVRSHEPMLIADRIFNISLLTSIKTASVTVAVKGYLMTVRNICERFPFKNVCNLSLIVKFVTLKQFTPTLCDILLSLQSVSAIAHGDRTVPTSSFIPGSPDSF